MKKIILVFAFFGLFSFGHAGAQQSVVVTQPSATVDYADQVPVDSDLDGLTDQAEIQIYQTDPKNPDTDGDGYYDGTEILSVADPLDANSIPGMPPVGNLSASTTSETPWAWYISRVSGLVGFILLYISIFLALTIRVPFLRKFFSPLYALNAHGWIALQALIFITLHGLVLTQEHLITFSLKTILIPFASEYERVLVGLGTVGFYLMIILVATSYARKQLPFKFWRVVHFLNIVLYAGVIIHAYLLGTDIKIDIVRNIFVVSNILLILLMLANMFVRIRQNIARKNAAVPNPE